MPKAFSENERNLIQKQLLEEGSKQFSVYGLKKTNIDELAAAVGISKGAFYLFYESKEALFMDVVEEAERRFREEVLATIELPAESPRKRLFTVFKRAFTLWKTIPILQLFTHGEYQVLYRKVPAEKFQQHLAQDRVFIEDLVRCCKQAGIPIRASVDQIDGLLHTMFFVSMHEDDFGPEMVSGTLDLLIELLTAFCLGEVSIQGYA